PALLGPEGALPWRDERDYRRNLALLRSLPLVLDRAIARFRQGMGSGVLETRLTTTNMIAQLDELLARSPGTPSSPRRWLTSLSPSRRRARR
ncbi:MAG: DUF885 domain-containing protein, partial [Novosphingobium sp.]